MAAEINEILRTSFSHCYPSIGGGDMWHNSVLKYDEFFPNAFIGLQKATSELASRKYNLSFNAKAESLVSMSVNPIYGTESIDNPAYGFPVPLTMSMDVLTSTGYIDSFSQKIQFKYYNYPDQASDHYPVHVVQIIRDTLSARGIGYNDGSNQRPFNHLDFITNPSCDDQNGNDTGNHQLGVTLKGDIRGFSVSYNSGLLALSGSQDYTSRYGLAETSTSWDLPVIDGYNTIHGRIGYQGGLHANRGKIDPGYMIRLSFGKGSGGHNNTDSTYPMGFNLALGPITDPGEESPSSGAPGDRSSHITDTSAYYETAFNTRSELHTTNGHQEYTASYVFARLADDGSWSTHAGNNNHYGSHGGYVTDRPAPQDGHDGDLGDGLYDGGGSGVYITKESDANVAFTGKTDINHVIPIQFKWQVIYDYDNSTAAITGLSAYSVKDVLIHLKGIGSGKPISIAHTGIPTETTTAVGLGAGQITSLKDKSVNTVSQAVSARFIGTDDGITSGDKGVLEWIEDKLNASINDPSLRDMYVGVSSIRPTDRKSFGGLGPPYKDTSGQNQQPGNFYTQYHANGDGIPLKLYPIMGNVAANTIKGEDTGNSIQSLPFPPFIRAYPLTEYTAAADNSDVDLTADSSDAPFICPSMPNQQDASRGNILIDQRFDTGVITTSGTGTIKTKIHAPYKDHWPDKTDVVTGINMGIAHVYRGSSNQAYIAGHISGVTPPLATTGTGPIADTQADVTAGVVFPGISGVSQTRHSGISFYENDIIGTTTLDTLSGKEMTIAFREGA
jgi:hypothetical protein